MKKNSLNIIYYFLIKVMVMVCCFGLSSCISSSSSDTDNKGVTKIEDNSSTKESSESELELSSSLRTFINSLSNNKYTSKSYNKQKAADFAQKIEASMLKDKSMLSEKEYARTLTSLIAAQRLAGADISSILDTARKYIIIGMKKDRNKQLPSFSKLEIALASIKSRKFALAEHFLTELLANKEKNIKAAALTAKGMIALYENRLPEAVESWKEALKVDSDYEPALFNIGFVAAKYGDLQTAESCLGKLSSDWYALSGLIAVERTSKDPSKISGLCTRVLAKSPQHKPTLISCGLYELQINKNFKVAKEYATKANSINSGVVQLDDAAVALLDEISKAKIQQEQKELQEQKAKAAEEKNKKLEQQKAQQQNKQQQQQQNQQQNKQQDKQQQQQPNDKEASKEVKQ